jgi:flagellar biosynthesis/type III secretory pathway protein FliH
MNYPLTARRIAASDAAELVDRSKVMAREVGATFREAKELVETARAETRRIRQIAESQAAARDSAFRMIATETVDRYLDKQRIEAAAIAAARLIRDAGAIRKEFDALTPWLCTFLREAVERLLGEINDDQLIARLVAQGAASFKSARDVVVLVHPSDLGKLQAAQVAHPLLFTGVTGIRADTRLRPGAVTLEGEGGSVDASLMTQVDILCREIEGAA